ncbi:MAG: hypothetical protein LBH89_02710 [Lactococcus lactis]|jgi:predicted DNA-binding protein (UPF0251 family)|nr:hypothetical protein [Lactococcus lactis]
MSQKELINQFEAMKLELDTLKSELQEVKNENKTLKEKELVPLWKQKTLNMTEACLLMGMSEPTLKTRIKNRDIRVMRVDKSIKIYNYELDAYCQRATEAEWERSNQA